MKKNNLILSLVVSAAFMITFISVGIQHSAKGKGKLILKYNSVEQLEGILDHIK